MRVVRRAAGGLLTLALLIPAVQCFAASPEAAEAPRGYGFLSARVFNHFVQMPVAHQMAVRESVLGAWTEGTQSTKGLLTMRSVPDPAHGAFEFRLIGQSRCDDSVSRKGPATVFGSAVTELDARVRLILANDKFQIESIQATGQTSSQLHDVQTRGALMDALAWRRANKKLPAVEQEVTRMSEERLSAHLRKEIDGMLAQVNNAIATKAKQPLAEAGAWPQFRFSTDESGLHFQAFPAGTARPIESPFPAGWKTDADLALCVHESLLEQMVDQLLGGKEITDAQILKIMETITGSPPRPLWVHERSERWSVTLAAKHPVRIAFHDDAIHVVVSVAETVRGNQRIAAPAQVAAAFKVTTAQDGPVFTRHGGLAVEMLASQPDDSGPGESILTDRKVAHYDEAQTEAVRTFLASKFSGILPEEFAFDTLAPPAGAYGTKMREVRPKSYAFENGWAQVVYVLQKLPSVK